MERHECCVQASKGLSDMTLSWVEFYSKLQETMVLNYKGVSFDWILGEFPNCTSLFNDATDWSGSGGVFFDGSVYTETELLLYHARNVVAADFGTR